MNYIRAISYLSAITVLLPVVTALFNIKHDWRSHKWLWYFLLNHLLSEVVTISMALNKIRNLEAMLFFSFIEGICVLFLYKNTIETSRYKRVLTFLLPIYCIGFLSVYFLVDYSLFIPSYTYPFHQSVMLIPLVLFFAERMNLMDDIFITNNLMFWISCGFLFYYSVSMFYFGSHDTLFKDYPAVSKNGWLIHSVSLITLNLFLARGIWQIRKT